MHLPIFELTNFAHSYLPANVAAIVRSAPFAVHLSTLSKQHKSLRDYFDVNFLRSLVSKSRHRFAQHSLELLAVRVFALYWVEGRSQIHPIFPGSSNTVLTPSIDVSLKSSQILLRPEALLGSHIDLKEERGREQDKKKCPFALPLCLHLSSFASLRL